MKKVFAQLTLGLVFCNCYAENLNYNFINPSFLGGNPNNASGLLNLANAQNPFKAPVDTPAERFAKSIESAVYSKKLSSLFAADPLTDNTLVGIPIQTENSIILIKESLNVRTITITDKATGAVTTFTVDITQ
jgi:Type VIII secretion system (T8SS), CsgF protein